MLASDNNNKMKRILKNTNKPSGSGRKCLTAAFITLGIAMHLSAQSPYIHRVYDYMPAPGQFVNDMPYYEPGDTQEDMNRKAEEEIAGVHHDEGMVSLGGYGGYIIFGFDHEVANVPGKYDFRIIGNAFYAEANPNGEASPEGGSCEPGIVMVSRDVNGNGLPDDPWYELAGSEYHRPQTVHNYRITYYRPDENKVRDPDPNYPYINDRTYIRWTTNGHGDGYLFRNVYHTQSYYPLWVRDDALTFEGSRLADNSVDESGRGNYYVLYAYHWGYADNQPNTDNRSGFSIEWAVDASGNRVSLPGIHFVKVYTAINQYCGWIGETSTEISGAEDLHLTGRDAAVPVFTENITLDISEIEMQPGDTRMLNATVTPANATNKAVTWLSDNEAVATVSAGTVTAHATGTAVIQAITNDGYYIATCNVTVKTKPPGPVTVAVTGVTLNSNALGLHPGDRATLTATVNPPNATNRSVSWSSSKGGVAEVTVNGLVIAFAPGTAVITAKTADGGFTASCNLTVTDPVGTLSPGDVRPYAFYAAGVLHLRHLEGYTCTVISLAGQSLLTFSPASSDERQPCRLPPGVYILLSEANCKGREGAKAPRFKIFKFIIV
jgi:uncharacterized protein YjdB